MTKTIKSKVLISALFVTLLCVLISVVIAKPTSAEELTPTASGSCGDNATWEYYANTGELKILGRGEMNDYDSIRNPPWYNYLSDIKSISIAETMTHIGDFAFANCNALTDVIFNGDSQLVSIAHSAFVLCNALESIEIPSSVKSIEMYAFDSCTNLKNIKFGNNSQLRGISIGAFCNCDSLTSIELPSNVVSIDYMAFSKCENLRSITLLSKEVVSIDETVFSFTDIEAIYVPVSVFDIYKESEEWREYEDIIFSLGKFAFSESKAQAGETIIIDICIKNNPGIAVASITLDYDKNALTLKNVENGEVFDSLDVGINLLWSADGNCAEDGVLATLTFEVNENAEAKDYTISAVVNEAYNEDSEKISLSLSEGKITVFDFLYGDADGSGDVGLTDVLLLRKYMANYDYSTKTSTVSVKEGADANGDGEVGLTDVLLMRKYMANYDYSTGTSSIVLGPRS